MYFNPFRDFLQRVLFGARKMRRGARLRTQSRSRHLSRRDVRSFSLAAEVCEARMLLSVTGPQLIQVTPNAGVTIATNTTPATATVENQAPTQLTFTFSPGVAINPTTLGAITVSRAGSDGTLGTADDVNVGIGSIQVDPSNNNQVILRFQNTLVDDLYQINISNTLQDTSGNPFNASSANPTGLAQDVDFRVDFGSQVVSVVPQPVLRTSLLTVTDSTAANLVNGSTFTLTTYGVPETFQFTTGVAGSGQIHYTSSDNAVTLAGEIQTALMSPPLYGSFTIAESTAPGSATLSLTGTAFTPVVNLSDTVLTVANASLANLNATDGTTFTVTPAVGSPVTFEFTKSVGGSSVPANDVPIVFDPATETATSLATEMALAINGSTLGPVAVSQNGAALTFNEISKVGSLTTPAGLLSVATGVQGVSITDGGLTQASNKIIVYFNQNPLNPAQAKDPAYYQVINTTTGTILQPTTVNYHYDALSNTNNAVLVFASNLPAGTFHLEIGAPQLNSTPNTTAVNLGALFGTSALQPVTGGPFLWTNSGGAGLVVSAGTFPNTVVAGSILQGPDGNFYTVGSVTGSATLTLTTPFSGGPTIANTTSQLITQVAGQTPLSGSAIGTLSDPTNTSTNAKWTHNSATITGTGTTFLSTVSAGEFLLDPNGTTIYTVQSVTDDTHLTLTTAYTGSTTTTFGNQFTSANPATPIYKSTTSWQNGNTIVQGYGTTFDTLFEPGEIVQGPDGNFYSIQSINAALQQITLTTAYLGVTSAGVTGEQIVQSPVGITPLGAPAAGSLVTTTWNPGSNVVAGIGTDFQDALHLGEYLLGPDGAIYTVSSIDPTLQSLTVSTPFAGLNVVTGATTNYYTTTTSWATVLGVGTVTGYGTHFSTTLQVGQILQGPDHNFYAIQKINSDTSLTLATAFAGTSPQGGGTAGAVPAGGYVTQGFIGNDTSNSSTDPNAVNLYQFTATAGTSLTVNVSNLASTLSTGLLVKLFDVGAIGTPLGTYNAGTGTLTYSGLVATHTYVIAVSTTANNAYSLVAQPLTNNSYTYAVTGAANGVGFGSYRLTANVGLAITPAGDTTSFASATNVGTLGAAGFTITNAITPVTSLALPAMPGGIGPVSDPNSGTPGNRNLAVDGISPATTGGESTDAPNLNPSTPTSIPVFYYNFGSVYGRDPFGNLLTNDITDTQMQDAREIFAIYGQYLGIQFVETTSTAPSINGSTNLTVVTGNPQAVSPNGPTIGVGGITGTDVTFGLPEVIMNDTGGVNFGTSPYGGSWFGIAFHEIGHALGLSHSTDAPGTMNGSAEGAQPAGQPTLPPVEQVYPGDIALVPAENIHPPDSTDINMYQFTLTQAGTFSAQTIAQRLTDANGNPDPSLLDTVLTVYSGTTTQAVNKATTFVPGFEIDFTASTNGAIGAAGNGISLVFNKSGSATSEVPAISVSGNQITVTLSAAAGFQTTAQDLINAIANDPLASNLVNVSLTAGELGTTVISGTTVGTLTLAGGTGSRTVIARNDNYFGNDSYVNLHLGPGTYYVAVSSTGNTNFDPSIADSGAGGRTDGAYQLKMNFVADPSPSATLNDAANGSSAGGIALAGDGVNTSGTAFNFWFQGNTAANTAFVDKLPGSNLAAPLGSITNPYSTISDALGGAAPGTIVRIVGNGGADGNPLTLSDATPYLIGFASDNVTPEADGSTFIVPKGVTVMIDAGAVIKLHSAIIDVGDTVSKVDRSGGALQVLGTPNDNVVFTSLFDNSIGGISDPNNHTGPSKADWGGIFFHQSSDVQGLDTMGNGIFLDSVNQASFMFGGGQVNVNSVLQVVQPIDISNPDPEAQFFVRPAIWFDNISQSADAAMSADPNSFADTVDRVGPDVYGNTIVNNSLNGMRILIQAAQNLPVEQLGLSARITHTDLVYILQSNLLLTGNAGGPFEPDPNDPTHTGWDARIAANLVIDPGTILKISGSAIETQPGSAQIIAEGTAANPIIFTSISDNSYGAGGSYQTSSNATATPNPGDWGGLFFNANSKGSIDHAVIDYAGGAAQTDSGSTDNFNPVEIQQAQVRITNTLFQNNAGGAAATDRNGLLTNDAAAIFVRGAQPVIADNTFIHNAGYIISVNANALNNQIVADWGDSTGLANFIPVTYINYGPLVFGNTETGASGNASTTTVPVVGSNVDISQLPGNQSEGAITIDRTNPLRLFSFSNNSTNGMIGSYSTDGGATWNSRQMLDGTDGLPQAWSDPTVTADAFGNLFIGYVDFAKTQIDILKSTDFGQTFSLVATLPAAASVIDQPTVVAAKTGATGSLWVTYRDFNKGLMVAGAQVTGLGLVGAFSVPQVIPGTASDGNFGDIAIGPTGDVMVAYESPTSGTGPANLFVSLDATGLGGTFAAPVNVTATNVGGFDPLPGQPTRTVDAEVGLAWDRTSGRVYMVYTDAPSVGSPHTELFVRHSDDNGTTWSAPVTVGDVPVNADSMFLPRIAVDNAAGSTQGDIAVSWYDARNDPTLASVQFFTAISTDHGATFGANVQVSTGTSNATLASDPNDFGDYTGLDFNAGVYYPMWADNSPTLAGNPGAPELDQATARVTLGTGFASSLSSQINGMEVRAEEITTQTVWDDTDIVHIVTGQIDDVINQHTFGGIRLESNANSSLVVKFTKGAGFLIDGIPLDITDRIGGALQVIGTSAHPVVLTSLQDDSVGAGFAPNGQPQLDTNGDGNATTAAPGDWNGITLGQYSNDRNVAVVVQATGPTGLSLNTTPGTAQFMGTLAPDLATDTPSVPQGGSDYSPLGFDIHGALSNPADVNVYSFNATAGTEVWFQIGNSSPALATVLELVNSSGQVLASSDAATGTNVLGGAAMTIVKDPTLGGAFYSTNPRDAMMRVILPGPSGTYYIRVRSDQAQTQGAYELQVRLRQQWETPGSTIQYSDVAYSTTGINVEGLPANSPLAGTTTSNLTNSTSLTNGNGNGLAVAQNIGNMLASNSSTLDVSGTLNTSTQVDWYKFTLSYDLIQSIGGVNGAGKTFSTIFDINYAGGSVGPNTTMSVFDSNGNLILVSRDSNVTSDQPGPGQTGVSDLSRGSASQLDPFIGAVQMPTGTPATNATGTTAFTYYVAISSNSQLPTALNAAFPNGSTNSLVRLQPVTSVQRIVEDHIGFTGYTTGQAGVGTSNIPQTDPNPLLPINTTAQLASSVTPYTLSDVVLYGVAGGNLVAMDPYSGYEEYSIGPASTIKMNTDGTLYGVSGGTTLEKIDTGTAAPTVVGAISIPVYNAATVPADPNQLTNATIDSFVVSGSTLFYAIHDAPAPLTGPLATGNLNNGLGASRLYVGNIASGSAAGGVKGEITRFTGDPSIGFTTGMELVNGLLYGVSSTGKFYSINTASGGVTIIKDFSTAANGGITGFTGLTLGPQNLAINGVAGALSQILFATTTSGQLMAFNTSGQLDPIFAGNVSSVTTQNQTSAGPVAVPLTGLAFSPLDFNLWHPTTLQGNVPGHGIDSTFDNSILPSPAVGDQNSFGVTLGSTTSTGKAVDLRATSQQQGGASFYFGFEPQLVTPLTTASEGYIQYPDATGAPINAQYGVQTAAFQAALGGTATTPNTNIVGSTPDLGGYNLPGGAHGSLVTNSFSLAGYSPGDQPTLYFNYLLGANPPSNGADTRFPLMTDSARVFASSDGGVTWQEIATNNSELSITTNAELPAFLSPSVTANPNDSKQAVQQLYDTSNWLQARIDLSNFAGASNIKLRFDFSTTGTTVTENKTKTGLTTQGLAGDGTGVGPNSALSVQNNNKGFAGWFIDDIIVGFANRGEMVTGVAGGAAAGNTSFFTIPQNPYTGAPSQILTGPYQLEIRPGQTYGAQVSNTFPAVKINPGLVVDDNQRMVDGITITAPAGNQIADGQIFTISDGDTTLTFQFNQAGATIPAGQILVAFNDGSHGIPADSAPVVARAIRDAINAAATAGKFKVTAEISDGTITGTGPGPTSAFPNFVSNDANVDLINALAASPLVAAPDVTISLGGSFNDAKLNGIGGATIAGIVTVPFAVTNSLPITLSAIDPTTGAVATNVTFTPSGNWTVGAGNSTMAFTITGNVTAGSFPGDVTDLIKATAAGYTSVSTPLDVIDNEISSLAITESKVLSVGNQTIAGNQVTVNTDTFTVNVGSGTKTFQFVTNIANVTGSNIGVLYVAGDTAATLAADMATAINSQFAGVASTPAVTSGSDAVVEIFQQGVTPTVTTSITHAGFLTVGNDAEGVTVNATVTRTSSTTSDLFVNLATLDPTIATVSPNPVKIAAGSTQAVFQITGNSNSINTGTRPVTIVASANGLTSSTPTVASTATVAVTDDGVNASVPNAPTAVITVGSQSILTNVVTSGDTVSVTVGGVTKIFQFVTNALNVTAGDVAVVYTVGDNANALATYLAGKINTQFPGLATASGSNVNLTQSFAPVVATSTTNSGFLAAGEIDINPVTQNQVNGTIADSRVVTATSSFGTAGNFGTNYNSSAPNAANIAFTQNPNFTVAAGSPIQLTFKKDDLGETTTIAVGNQTVSANQVNSNPPLNITVNNNSVTRDIAVTSNVTDNPPMTIALTNNVTRDIVVNPNTSLITDGDTFTLDNGAVVTTFQFHISSALGGNTAINYIANDTVAHIATDIANAINTAAIAGITASTSGGTVILTGPNVFTNSVNTAAYLTSTSPDTFTVNGTTFQWVTASDTLTSVSNVAVTYSQGDSAATMAGEMALAINTAAISGVTAAVNPVGSNNVVLTGATTPPSFTDGGITNASFLTPSSPDSFTLNGGGGPVTFQFVASGHNNLVPGNVQITYTSGDSAHQLALDMVAKINAQSIPNVSASLSGLTTVVLTGTSTFSDNLVNSAFLTPSSPDTFVLTGSNGPVKFQFVSNLADRTGTNVAVLYNAGDGTNQLANEIRTAINGTGLLNLLYTVPPVVGSTVVLNPTTAINPPTFFDTGTLGTPTLLTPSSDDSFTVSNGVTSKTFQFVTNSIYAVNGNVAIVYAPGASAATLAADMVSAINTAAIPGVSAATAGVGLTNVVLTDASHTVVFTTTGTITNPGFLTTTSSVANGPTIVATPGPNPNAFTITLNTDASSVNAGGPTPTTAQQLVTAINGGLVNAALTSRITAIVSTAAATPSTVNTDITSPYNNTFTVANQIVPNLVTDGDTFTVDDGTGPVTFQFRTLVGNLTPGDVWVQYTAGSTAAQLAADMVTAINGRFSSSNPASALGAVVSLQDANFNVIVASKTANPGFLTRSLNSANVSPMTLTTHSFAASTTQFAVPGSQPNPGNGLYANYSVDGGVTWIKTPDYNTTVSTTPGLMLTGTGASGDGLGGNSNPGLNGNNNGTGNGYYPQVVTDKFGNLFMVVSDFGNLGVSVLMSTDFGQTWSVLLDTPNITVAPTIATGNGVLWIAYHDAAANNISARGATVTGLGAVNAASFATIAVVPTSSNGNYPSLSIGPAGQAVVAYENLGSGDTGSFAILSSVIASVGGAFTVPTNVSQTKVGGTDTIPALTNVSINAAPSVAYDLTNNRIYVAYTDEISKDSGNTEVFVRYSDDGGLTWSPTPLRVNDDTTTNSQFMPRIAVDNAPGPDQGEVAVTWYDTRNDPTNKSFQVYSAVMPYSLNNPSFGTNVLVSNGSSQTATAANDIDMGNYIGLDFNAGVLTPIWADNSTAIAANPGNGTTFDVATSQITLVPPTLPPVLTVTTSAGNVTESGATLNTITGNVTLSGPYLVPATGLVVQLTSTNPLLQFSLTGGNGTFTSSLSVTIPENSTTTPKFFIEAPSDSLAQGPETAIITPSVSIQTKFDDVSAAVVINEIQSPALSVKLNKTSVSSGTTVTGTVTRDTPTTQNLFVDVISSNPFAGTVINQPVEILAGQSSATFSISTTGDLQGLASVTTNIFAVAHGFLSASDTNANDPAHAFQTLTVTQQSTPVKFFKAYDYRGDQNTPRNQGQLEITNNTISNASKVGIMVQPGVTDPVTGVTPYAGSVIAFPSPANTARLVPGPNITSNIIYDFGQAGIDFEGTPTVAGQPAGAVPFGYIVNNTIYGGASPTGTGITVKNNAGPTIMNNIIANTVTGITVDPSSAAVDDGQGDRATVIDSNIFFNNTTDAAANGVPVTSSQNNVLSSQTAGKPLFVNPGSSDISGTGFYLKENSPAIDSARTSLSDRSTIASVRTTELKFPTQQISSPTTDRFNQLRVDDTNVTNTGLGANPFIDRGAVERADTVGPKAQLINPLDNGAEDGNSVVGTVFITAPTGPLTQFSIQLTDQGVGIDNSTVTSAAFTLKQDGVTLNNGTDYQFVYNPNTHIVSFNSGSVFSLTSTYVITIDTTKVKDLAGNNLQGNQPGGASQFTISSNSPPVLGPIAVINAQKNVNATITYAELAATLSVAPGHTVKDLLITSITAGVTLHINSASGPLAVVGTIIDATTNTQLVWTNVPLGQVGLQPPIFQVVGYDPANASLGAALSQSTPPRAVQVNLQDTAPKLNAFTYNDSNYPGTPPVITENTPASPGPTSITITFAQMVARVNAGGTPPFSDADTGDVPVSFTITNVNGTLLVDGNPVTTPVTFTAGHTLKWTPPQFANGTATSPVAAFTMTANDGQLNSSPAAQVSFVVTAEPSAPVLLNNFVYNPSPAPQAPKQSAYAINFNTLLAQAGAAVGSPTFGGGLINADGHPLKFKITGVTSGSLLFDGSPVTPTVGSPVIFTSTDTLFWTSASVASPTLVAAFTVEAYDSTNGAGFSTSSPPVTVSINVSNQTGPTYTPTTASPAMTVPAYVNVPTVITYQSFVNQAVSSTSATPAGVGLAWQGSTTTTPYALGFVIQTAIAGTTLTRGTTTYTNAQMVGMTFKTGDFITWNPPTSSNGPGTTNSVFTVLPQDLTNGFNAAATLKVNINLQNAAPTLQAAILQGATLKTPYVFDYNTLLGATNALDKNNFSLKFNVSVTTAQAALGTLKVTHGTTTTTVGTTAVSVVAGDTLTWTPVTTLASGSYASVFNASVTSIPTTTTPVTSPLTSATVAIGINVAPLGSLFSLTGEWIAGGGLASITQTGSTVVVTDQNLKKGTFTFSTGSTLSVVATTPANATGLTAGTIDVTTADDGRIIWSTATGIVIWQKLQLSGQYVVQNVAGAANGSVATITQNFKNLSYTFPVGGPASFTGLVTSATGVTGFSGGTGVIAGNVITFNNGQIWTKIDVPNNYTNSLGGTSQILQQFNATTGAVTTVVVNRLGQSFNATFTSATQLTAVASPLGVGTIANGKITWSGTGEVWSQALVLQGVKNGTTTAVKITASPTVITMTDGTNTFTVRLTGTNSIVVIGVSAGAQFTTSTTGTRKNGSIIWSNNITWSGFDFNALDALFYMATTKPFP